MNLQVLSRTPELSDEVYNQLLQHASNEGYDISQLHKTQQIPEIGGGGISNTENTDRVGFWWLKSLFGK